MLRYRCSIRSFLSVSQYMCLCKTPPSQPNDHVLLGIHNGPTHCRAGSGGALAPDCSLWKRLVSRGQEAEEQERKSRMPVPTLAHPRLPLAQGQGSLRTMAWHWPRALWASGYPLRCRLWAVPPGPAPAPCASTGRSPHRPRGPGGTGILSMGLLNPTPLIPRGCIWL